MTESVRSLLQHRAAERSEDVFAIFPADETAITFGDLYLEACRWVSHLRAQGLGEGSRITIIAKKSRELLPAYFGSLLLGVAVHIVDERIDHKDMVRSIGGFEPHLIVFDTFGATRLSELGSNAIPTSALLAADELTKFEPGIVNDVPADAPAICVFTSGSTGDPKGILSSHENLLFAAGCLDVHELSASDRALGLTPISGTNGQVFSIWAPLVTGGSTVLYQGMFSSFLALDWASEHSATWINGTPTYLSLFLANPVDRNDFDLAHLRFYRSASAPLPAPVQDGFEASYQIPIIETMGLSEMTGQVFANPPAVSERRQGSVGQPWRTDLRIVDPDGRDVEVGTVGELEVRSKGLMLGYHRDPETTAKAITDGWLRTGDLGLQDEDGFVFIKGRKKDIAIVGGKNVSLREVDDALYRLEGVQLATSFSVPDQTGGERIVAVLQLQPSASSDIEQLTLALRDDLAPYQRPKEIIVWDALVTGGAGKVLRSRARQEYLQEYEES